MTDTPGTRPETDLDRLRREAFTREAAALRVAALEHFKKQAEAELTGLRSVLATEIKTAVREAMTDQAVKEALRKELTEQVLGTVSEDIAKKIGARIEKEVGQAEARVIEKVRTELLESWAKAARKALNEGVDKARNELARDMSSGTTWQGWLQSVLPRSERTEDPQKQVPSVKRKPAEATPSGEAEDLPKKVPAAPTPPTIPPPLPNWYRPDSKGRGRMALSVLGVVALALSIYTIWRTLTEDRRSIQEAPEERPSISSSPTTAPSSSPGQIMIADDRLRKDWMRIVNAAESGLPQDSTLLASLRAHPFSDQFSCWFSSDARKGLESLAWRRSPDDVSDQLESTFEPCFRDKPSLRDPGLAIFSAQATVAEAFSQFRGEWDSWCANGGEARPVAGMTADGFTGPTTRTSMNLFLTCTGHSAELSIGADSNVPQYLYVTYLALRELQR